MLVISFPRVNNSLVANFRIVHKINTYWEGGLLPHKYCIIDYGILFFLH